VETCLKASTVTLFTVSALRNRFVNLKNSAAENIGKIARFENEVTKVRPGLQKFGAANQSARIPLSLDRIGETPQPVQSTESHLSTALRNSTPK
jgi:hypothetical protein